MITLQNIIDAAVSYPNSVDQAGITKEGVERQYAEAMKQCIDNNAEHFVVYFLTEEDFNDENFVSYYVEKGDNGHDAMMIFRAAFDTQGNPLSAQVAYALDELEQRRGEPALEEYVADFLDAGDVEPSPRMDALYIGLQAEEFAEKLQVIQDQLSRYDDFDSPVKELITQLEKVGGMFKKGEYDDVVASADPVQMLDADIDLAWVSLGGSYVRGADVVGAIGEVGRSNLSKADPETGKMQKDANGKIMKPATYSPPDLTHYV